MAANGNGYLPANRRVADAGLSPFWRTQARLISDALAADTFRFDASDLMPNEIAQGGFWDAMLTYLWEGPGSVDRLLEDIEASWPDAPDASAAQTAGG